MAKPKPIADLIPTATQALKTKGGQTTTLESVNSLRQGVKIDKALEEIFADFRTLKDPILEKMLAASIAFCVAMSSDDAPAYWLVMLGQSGIGKTMLARKIVRLFNRRMDTLVDENRSDENHRYLRMGGFLDWGRCVNSMVADYDYGFVRQASEDWLVCLDDIGAESARHKDLSVSKLFQILGAREGKFTIITANLSVKDVAEKMDTRIASRLLRHGAVVLDIDVPDFNLRLLVK